MIVKCSHCKKTLSAKDFDSHECDLPLTATERIPVVYFQDESYKDKKLMTGWGTGGTLYTFEVTPREPIPITICPSDDSYHEPSNRRKVTRIRIYLEHPHKRLRKPLDSRRIRQKPIFCWKTGTPSSLGKSA